MACAPSSSAAAADREGAVREVARAYERIKIQQPLLLHHQCSAQLAHSLLGDALRALNVALSLINQQQPTSFVGGGVKAEPHHQLSPHIGGSPASADSEAAAVARRGKRRRSSASSAMEAAAAAGKSKSPPPPSWVHVTAMPYEDGFQWRKYGEKKINGTSHTRSYFRCTFKDETGCQATKHVQQTPDTATTITSGGHHHHHQPMPMFQVTYRHNHTCTTTTTSPPPQNGHAAAVVKQEEPPALEIPRPAVVPFDHQPPPLRLQEPPSSIIPIIGVQQFCGGTATTVTRDESSHGGGSGGPSTATSSCVSGESSDEYSGDMAAQMAAVEAASAGDDAFYDLELLRLLCDSFKDY